ncbi:phage holin family protein [Nocardia sp. NPDC059240]|uniref:phage holin family protein n=1 Tax=Nocardia sp. NPDC059240 TaxID=3346786 RepID=UPI0036B541BB
MAVHNHTYDSAIELRPNPVERLLRHLVSRFAAWAGPKLRAAGKFVLTELIRGVIAAALLGFALVAAIYGASYFIDFLIGVLDTRLPHWASLLITATALLIPAGAATLLGLWQLSTMKTARAGAGILTRLATLRRYAGLSAHPPQY